MSLLISSGDRPGVYALASDPDVTAVGGTTLGIGARNQTAAATRRPTAQKPGHSCGSSPRW